MMANEGWAFLEKEAGYFSKKWGTFHCDNGNVDEAVCACSNSEMRCSMEVWDIYDKIAKNK